MQTVTERHPCERAELPPGLQHWVPTRITVEQLPAPESSIPNSHLLAQGSHLKALPQGLFEGLKQIKASTADKAVEELLLSDDGGSSEENTALSGRCNLTRVLDPHLKIVRLD